MPPIKTDEFFSASAAAMGNPQLRRALDRVGSGFDVARRNAIDEVTTEVWEEWREEARQIKVHTLDHLDYYLELLHDNVTAAGGQVHYAKDAGEANQIVSHLAKSRGVKVATKSKSMVSEELELNPVLESVGVDVYETDLGEYIIQLAGETPSHLVAPALHKSKEDVAELFARKLGVPYQEDIEEMAAVARTTLRDKFMEADLGISGANFVVAETGTLVIITNEGNGRLCTSAPRMHIGITGMEKVIPSMQDLATFLRILPRSATGQRISSYVSMVTGPRRQDDEDGPEEFHLVLVDNGRSRLLGDPKLREALVLHPLRGLPQHLSGLPTGGRPRLRVGLSRAHRGRSVSRDGGTQRVQGPAPGLQPLRGLPRGLSHQNQHSPDVAGIAPPHRRKPRPAREEPAPGLSGFWPGISPGL